MTERTKGNDYIIWQNDPEDGISEKALLVEAYSYVVSISQEDRNINVNYESIDELCKLLKQIKKEY